MIWLLLILLAVAVLTGIDQLLDNQARVRVTHKSLHPGEARREQP